MLQFRFQFPKNDQPDRAKQITDEIYRLAEKDPVLSNAANIKGVICEPREGGGLLLEFPIPLEKDELTGATELIFDVLKNNGLI